MELASQDHYFPVAHGGNATGATERGSGRRDKNLIESLVNNGMLSDQLLAFGNYFNTDYRRIFYVNRRRHRRLLLFRL